MRLASRHDEMGPKMGVPRNLTAAHQGGRPKEKIPGQGMGWRLIEYGPDILLEAHAHQEDLPMRGVPEWQYAPQVQDCCAHKI